MKNIFIVSCFLFFITHISGQSYVASNVLKSDGSSIDVLVKTPFPSGRMLKFKRNEGDKVETMPIDQVEYLTFLPGTDSQIFLKQTHTYHYNFDVDDAKKSKKPEWLRVLGNCDELEFFEFFSVVKSSRSELFIYLYQNSRHYMQRNGEKYPTLLTYGLNPNTPDTEAIFMNDLYSKKYFEDSHENLEKIEKQKITFNTFYEIFSETCN